MNRGQYQKQTNLMGPRAVRKAIASHLPRLIRRPIRAIFCLIADPDYRQQLTLRLRKPRNLFQPFNHTRPDRYPALFQFAVNQLKAGQEINILSFGCSTGEEVFALNHYLPNARITGLDINSRNIRKCHTKLAEKPNSRLRFTVANSTAMFPEQHFDAIFCLSVLRHGSLNGGVPRCDHLIRFADFEETVTDFHRCLKPGGFLFIANSNFRLADTAAYSEFQAVLHEDINAPDPRMPIYDRNNDYLDGAFYRELGFRKHSIEV